MSEKNNLPKNDKLREKFAGIDRMVTAPANLVEAVKKGEVIASAGNRYTAGFHVRKFAKAAVAYAVCASLFLGLLILLPDLFEGNSPAAKPPSQSSAIEDKIPEGWEVVSTEENISHIRMKQGADAYQWLFYKPDELSKTSRRYDPLSRGAG